MKLVSWNVNGIRAVENKGLLKPFFESLQPDIVCFQETKAHQHQFTKTKKDNKKTQSLFGSLPDGVEEDDEITIKGYREYWNSAQKSGYAGTAIFCKEEPMSVVRDIPQEYIDRFHVKPDTFGDPNNEGRVIVGGVQGVLCTQCIHTQLKTRAFTTEAPTRELGSSDTNVLR